MEVITWLISAPFICIGWIILGFAAGAVARRLMGTKNYPIWQDLLLGIMGAVVGGFLVSFVGGLVDVDVYRRAESGLALYCANFVVATIGAMFLIFVRRRITGGR
ncbi:MAG: GlsB/YeaQ/YmgE family stress response membrane protein [Anaerolineae bacterium]|jgi:uncharacterized membrane protein YeaQ/YmgE (transglycosylase-associated protein family)|nr:GlsB/YeaQ/YmgE family stress response membrane protein [Anaerolineae bacterium]